jgi:hypothetical protein
MPIQEANNETMLTQSFASLLEKAQANAARLGYPPDVFAKKLQQAKDDPEGAKRKADEHASRMGVNVEAVMRKEASANPSPFPTSERLPVQRLFEAEIQEKMSEDTVMISVEEQTSSPATNVEVSERQTPKVISRDSTIAQLPVSKTHVRKRDDINAKNDWARSRSVKLLKKSSSKSVSPATGVAAESSRTSAIREAAPNAERSVMDYAPSLFADPSELYTVPTSLPKWYTDIGNSRFEMKELAKKRTPALTALESLKNCIGRCEEHIKSSNPAHKMKLRQLLEELRGHVHKAEFLPGVNKFVVKKVRILTAESGLPRIFREEAGFPSDLRADSYQLYSRWMKQDFSLDIYRGIVRVKGQDRSNDRFDPTYIRTSAKSYGANGLVLGQWWPSQLCTLRDGAHGVTQGGIFGENGKGAYSIVLSGGGGYHDQDDGDTIEYSGTESKNEKLTDATQQMITSSKLGNEIRVLRSYNLPSKNPYRPEVGFRYDGLYKVKHAQLIDEKKQMYRFKMERCPGQEPIRYENAAKRPTREEVDEFKKVSGMKRK